MVYIGNNKTYDFRNFQTIRIFGGKIMNNITSLHMANDEQNHLAKYIKEFKSKGRSQSDSKCKISKRRHIK